MTGATRRLTWLLFAACTSATTRQPASAVVIHVYKKDLGGIRTGNPNVRLRVDRDPAMAEERVLFVEYPPPTNDPAGRDVHLDADTRDWTAAKAIAFRIKPEHAIKLSVSFVDRNRVVYTAWSELRAGVWQSIRLSFDDLKPNPYFQPPDARRGSPIDVGEVSGIGFAPQDAAAGRFAISQFVLVR